MKNIKLKKHKFKGKLIVFEGIDGSGKTTLLNLTKKYLTEHEIDCVSLKMPSDFIRNHKIFQDYDNSINPQTRNDIDLTNLTIFVTGDRLLSLDSQIIPALKRGDVVLCDRYCYTGYVRCTNKVIAKLCQRFIKPDLVIYAKIDFTTAKQRVKSRAEEKDNFYDEMDVLKQIKKFDDLAKYNNFKIIETTLNQTKINQNLIDCIKKTVF